MGRRCMGINCLRVLRCLFWIGGSVTLLLNIILFYIENDEEKFYQTITTGNLASKEMHAVVFDYLQLMRELDTQTVLVEPFNLFCILNDTQRQLLLKRNFRLLRIASSPNVLNFALFGKDDPKFDSADANRRIRSYGFRHFQIQRSWETLSQPQFAGPLDKSLITHRFFVREHIVVHAVVFYERGQYLWHGHLNDIPQTLEEVVSPENLLFFKLDSAYERFSTRTVTGNRSTSVDLEVPLNPTNFLMEMQTARFVEPSNKNPPSTALDRIWSSLLKEAFLASHQALKKKLRPLLLDFWITEDILTDWIRGGSLDILAAKKIAYVAFSSGFDFLNVGPQITNALMESDTDMKFVEKHEILNGFKLLFKHDNKVTIEFIYVLGNRHTYWANLLNGTDYMRKIFPEFETCSSDFFGCKVLVPC